MLVVHMDSGLGNQMLDYAEYLAIQQSNPEEECLIENLIYELPDRPGMFSMWNGYELERLFGIQLPNVKGKFTKEAWERILQHVEESKFWTENWNYSPYIVEAFAAEGLQLQNLGRKKETIQKSQKSVKDMLRGCLTDFFQTTPGYHMKRITRLLMTDRLVAEKNAGYDIYRRYPTDSFVGHSFLFKYKGFGIEKIDEQIREAFVFPEITDERNSRALEMIQSCNAVSIHARRSDMLFLNGHCYKFGFFKRAVNYIKKQVENPVFVFFCDENSTGWCEENEKIFGLDFHKDQVRFVDWNKGPDSFRDMQLMAQCKHNIFTESTFGFWGSYLNQNTNKITCAPDVTILSTRTC